MPKAAPKQPIDATPATVELSASGARLRAWRQEAAAIYDELSHEQQVRWACDCLERALEECGRAHPADFSPGARMFERAWKIVRAARTGPPPQHELDALVRMTHLGPFELAIAGACVLLDQLVCETGPFGRPGLGVASWCQAAMCGPLNIDAPGADYESEQHWQLERLKELAG